MKMRLFLMAIILLGLGLTGYAIYQITSTKLKADNALEEAREVVKQGKESDSTEAFVPPPDGVIGLLALPKIEAELAIVKGTDPDDLEKGVGHYEGSFYPDQGGQIVLSGHRDTVFKRVGELEIGDELIVQLASGEYTYTVEGTKIVEADDTSIITLQKEKEELILTTCYPFGYVGNAPQRYIIYANRAS